MVCFVSAVSVCIIHILFCQISDSIPLRGSYTGERSAVDIFAIKEAGVLKEAKRLFTVTEFVLHNSVSALQHELEEDRVAIGNMPFKGISNRTLTPLVEIRNSINLDHHRQVKYRAKIEYTIQTLSRQHERACLDLRKARNEQVSRIEKSASNSLGIAAFVELASKPCQPRGGQECVHLNLGVENELDIMNVTLASAKVDALPSRYVKPKPNLLPKRIISVLKQELKAYKNERNLPQNMRKEELSNLNYVLKKSCTSKPEILILAQSRNNKIAHVQNITSSKLILFNMQMDQMQQLAVARDDIRMKRKRLMESWKLTRASSTELKAAVQTILGARTRVAYLISKERSREKRLNSTFDHQHVLVQGNRACSRSCRMQLRLKIQVLTKGIERLNRDRLQKLPYSKLIYDGRNNQTVASLEERIHLEDNNGFAKIGSCSIRSTCSLCLADNVCGWCDGKCMEGDQSKPYFLTCEPPHNWNHVNANSTCLLPDVNHNLNNALHGSETATFTDHINTTTGNETQNIRWPTRRMNSDGEKRSIPTYLGSEDIGSNLHWTGSKGVRHGTFSFGDWPCAGFHGTPAECEQAIRRYSGSNASIWKYLTLNYWNKTVRGVAGHVNGASLSHSVLLNHHFQHEGNVNDGGGGGVEDSEFDVGDKIDARWLGGCLFEEASITSVNPDGTFDVKYDTGRIEKHVLRAWVKPVQATGNEMCMATGCIEIHGGGCGTGKWAENYGGGEKQLSVPAPDSVCKSDDDCDGEHVICADTKSCDHSSNSCPRVCIDLASHVPSVSETNPFPEKVQDALKTSSLNRDASKQHSSSEQSGRGRIRDEAGRSPLAILDPNKKYMSRKDHPFSSPQEFPRKSMSFPTGDEPCKGLFHDVCALNVKCCWYHAFLPKLGECRQVGHCKPPKGRFPHIEMNEDSDNDADDETPDDPKTVSSGIASLSTALGSISPTPPQRKINVDGLCNLDSDCFMNSSETPREVYCAGDGHCRSRRSNRLVKKKLRAPLPPVVHAGVKCRSNGDCDDDLICGIDNACVGAYLLGEKCTVDAQCVDILKCSPSGTCMNVGGLDQTCSVAADCMYGLVCDVKLGLCKGDVGALCNSTRDCGDERQCSNGRLIPRVRQEVSQRNEFNDRHIHRSVEPWLIVIRKTGGVTDRYIDSTAQLNSKGNEVVKGRWRKDENDLLVENHHIDGSLDITNHESRGVLNDATEPGTIAREEIRDTGFLQDTMLAKVKKMSSLWCGEKCKKSKVHALQTQYFPFFNFLKTPYEGNMSMIQFCILQPEKAIVKVRIPNIFRNMFTRISRGHALGGATEGRAGIIGEIGEEGRFDPRDEPAAVRNTCRILQTQIQLFQRGSFDVLKLDSLEAESSSNMQNNIDQKYDKERLTSRKGSALGENTDDLYDQRHDMFHLSHCIWRAGRDRQRASSSCCPCNNANFRETNFIEMFMDPLDVRRVRNSKFSQVQPEKPREYHHLLSQWGDKLLYWLHGKRFDDIHSYKSEMDQYEQQAALTYSQLKTITLKNKSAVEGTTGRTRKRSGRNIFNTDNENDEKTLKKRNTCCPCKQSPKIDINNWARKYVYTKRFLKPDGSRVQCKDGSLSIACLRKIMRNVRNTSNGVSYMNEGINVPPVSPDLDDETSSRFKKRLEYAKELAAP